MRKHLNFLFFIFYRRSAQSAAGNLTQRSPKTIRIKGEGHFRRIDDIPEHYDLIYKNPMHYTFNTGKLISVLAPAIVAAVYSYIHLSNQPLEEMIIYDGLFISKHEMPFLGIGLMLIGTSMFYFCQKSVLRIYQHDKE